MPIEEQIKNLQAQVDELRILLFKKTGSGPSSTVTNSFKSTVLEITPGTTTPLLGFYGKAPAAQQTDGAGFTNNVTSGGSTDIIADYILTTYGDGAATIRNNIYQLARKVKIIGDALRTYGLLT